jgi:hypothetical protein
MAILTPALRTAGTWVFTPNNVTTPATLAPTAPTRTTGDLLLACTFSRSITATVATPTGWNLMTNFPVRSGTASGGSIYVFWRYADNTTTDSPSIVWSSLTTGTTGDSCSAVVIAYSNVGPTQEGTFPTKTTASAANATVPALTTTTDLDLVIGLVMKVQDAAQTWTAGSPYTEDSDSGGTTSGTGHTAEVSHVVKTPAGAVALTTMTASSATAGQVLGQSFALLAAQSLTKTQTTTARIQSTPTQTQTSIARVRATATKTQTATARIVGPSTKYYLLDAAYGSGPGSTDKIPATAVTIDDSGSNHSSGTSAASSVVSPLASTTGKVLIRRFVLGVLSTGSSLATGEVYIVTGGMDGSGVGGIPEKIDFALGVWRPSSSAYVATLYDGTGNSPAAWQDESAGTSDTRSAAITTSAGFATPQANDLLVLEVYSISSSIAAKFYYNGSTENSTNTNAASITIPNRVLPTTRTATQTATSRVRITATATQSATANIAAAGKTYFATMYYENGTSGSTLAGGQSDASSPAPTAIQSVAIGVGNSLTYDANPLTVGSLSAKHVMAGTNANADWGWTTNWTTQTGQFYVRAYFQFLALSTTTYHLFWGNNGATLAWRVQIQSNGTIQIQAGSTSQATSTTAITAGQTFRLECLMDHPSSAMTCRIFVGANSEGTVPDETISFSGVSINTQTTQFFLGSNQIPAVTFWSDGVGATTGDWPGPLGTAPVVLTKTQTAAARIQITGTKTQSSIARVQNTVTKTQGATARIQKSFTKTQTSVARVAITGTKTQTSVARVQISPTKTQAAIARISNTGMTKTQGAITRIQVIGKTKTQTSVARVQITGLTKTQTTIARIAISPTKTQAAVARVQIIPTKTQGAIARIQIISTKTQASISRIQNTAVIKTQSAVANIASAGALTKNQTAIARVSKSFTLTQSAIARISINSTKTQVANARIQKSFTKTQASIARIQISSTKTQTAIARVQITPTKTQTATARVSKVGITKTQGTVARLQNTFTKTQGAQARIQITSTKTQSAIANIRNTVTKNQSAVANIATSGLGGQTNNFNGGTDGTTLTSGSGGNTGGVSGDYFDTIQKPSDGILDFNATNAYTGGLAMRMATRTVTGALNVIWTATRRGALSEDYGRFYFYTDDKTTGGVAKNIIRWFNAGSSLGGILMGNNRLYVTDETNATVSGNSTTLLPASQWVRIEYHLHPRTDGTGSVQIKLWLSPASNGTPDWDFTISGRTYAANTTDQITIGNAGPGANWPTATGFIYFDEIIAGANNWPGPVFTGSTLTATQTAIARIRVTGTSKTQSAIARVQNAATKTQPATARVSKSGIKTQSATANIISAGKTQTATARILKVGVTKTQSAIASIVTVDNPYFGTGTFGVSVFGGPGVLTKAQTAIARIRAITTKLQVSGARIQVTGTKTQTATANIGTLRTKTQTSAARIQITGQTLTQTSVARVQSIITRTQSATARIRSGVTKTQTAIAQIRSGFTKTQVSVARIQILTSNTQPAIARIQNTTLTKTQTARAFIVVPGVRTTSQNATARVQIIGLTKTQPSISRIAKLFTKTQASLARVQAVGKTLTQAAVARVQIIGKTKTQTSIARVQIPGSKTQAAIARVRNIPTLVQLSTARVTKTLSITQTAIARVQIFSVQTQPAVARIRNTLVVTQSARAAILRSDVVLTQSATARITLQPGPPVQPTSISVGVTETRIRSKVGRELVSGQVAQVRISTKQ